MSYSYNKRRKNFKSGLKKACRKCPSKKVSVDTLTVKPAVLIAKLCKKAKNIAISHLKKCPIRAW